MHDDLVLHNYLVISLDLLGQGEVLRNIKTLPTSDAHDADKQAFLKTIKDSFGKVVLIRKEFEDYFELIKSHKPNEYKVPPEHRDVFIKAFKTEIIYYSFSDTVIIAVPLNADNEHCTEAKGIHDVLIVTAYTTLFALSHEIPLRAGIDIGIAGKIDDNEIYGPALERAYNMEKNAAEYPRLVIGQELFDYLSWVENKEYNTPFGKIAKENAKFCKQLISQDTDGRYMLDFLSTAL